MVTRISTIRELNRAFIDVITQPNCTQEQSDAALHAYLTDLRRDVPVQCYCPKCKAKVVPS